MPITSSVDAAMEVALDLTTAFKHPHPSTPFADVGHAQLSALRQLAEIFSSTMPPSTAPAPVPTQLKPENPSLLQNKQSIASNPRV